MTLKEEQNVSCTHISLRDRLRHLPEKKHRTIGRILVVMLTPLCITFSIALPFVSMIVSHYIIGDPHPNDVAIHGVYTSFFLASLILAEVLAFGALCLYWLFLVYLARKFHAQASRHGLTLALIQDSANREVYRLAHRNYQEYVESLTASYDVRVEELYSDNPGSETVSEVRDELRIALHEAEAQMEDIRRELLENEGKQDCLEFKRPKLSEISLVFALQSVAVIVILAIQYNLIF